VARILIIDDSAFMRTYIRAALEEAGHTVDDFLPSSTVEVMARVKTFEPDLVLSDFNMPDVNGLNVARTVKRTRPQAHILILTALRDPVREAELLRIGVARVLNKPLKGGEIAAAVAEFV
jgi:DNA-binding response OmpR family regulator